MYKIILVVYFFLVWNRYGMDMNWIWENELPMDIFEPNGYEDEYLFSYPIGYRIGFGYKVLSSDLEMSSTIPNPNFIYCHF